MVPALSFGTIPPALGVLVPSTQRMVMTWRSD
jgi:hypothetical protein